MRTLAAAAFMAFISTSAVAGVGPYQWGMTRQQVVSASGGEVRTVVGTPGQQVFGSDLGAEGDYVAAGLNFRAQFYFDPAGRLSGMRLHPESMTQCPNLLSTLQGFYGLGERTSMGSVWVDTEANNNVRFTSLGDECFAAYRPINRSGGMGL